jgi:general secretion pathway protein K
MERGNEMTHRVRGIALIAVLWIVAAMAIAVTGMTHAVRNEIRTAAAARSSIESQALGEAAIALAVQKMLAQRPFKPWARMDVEYRGQTMAVEAASLNGWIDINTAPDALLASLYTVAGGLPAQAASALAAATAEARRQKDATGREQRFEAPQDLMRVPGVDYDLYARLSPLLTAGAGGSAGRVNALAAPLPVLAVLAEGNIAQAQAVSQRRSQGEQTLDTSSLRGEWLDNNLGTRYRLQVEIPLGDGTQAIVSRDIDVRPDPRAGLPWRFFGSDYSIRAKPAQGA